MWCLAAVAQWIECWPVNQRFAGLIPSQGTCLGCWPGPQLGAHERRPHIDVSLPLSPSLSPKDTHTHTHTQEGSVRETRTENSVWPRIQGWKKNPE